MKIKKIGNIYGYKGGSYPGQVYHPDGLAPTINTMGGGNREPLIIPYDDYNSRIPSDTNIIGTITPNCGNSAFRNGHKLICVFRGRHNGEPVRKQCLEVGGYYL